LETPLSQFEKKSFFSKNDDFGQIRAFKSTLKRSIYRSRLPMNGEAGRLKAD